MTREWWERLKTILSEALDRPPAERESFVREAAGDDAALADEVMRLLEEDDRDSAFGSRPAAGERRISRESEAPRLSKGAVVARRFRVIRFIARGGMGEVYEAEDLELGGRVALKTLRPRVAPDDEMLALFRREVQLARMITHPNVCRIFDLVQDRDERTGESAVFVSMELLNGRTLSEALREHGPMTDRDALPLIEEIAAGLQAVHDSGVIHGDLKPGNVMLATRSGEARARAVVMDFGLASPVAHGISAGSPIRGRTPEFSAPEQAEGTSLTTATDVYCLALIIEHILGVSQSARLNPAASRMPWGWARLLRRCLSPDPRKRLARPAELAAALRASAGSRRRMATAAGAALILAAAVWAGLEAPGRPSNQKSERLVWAPPEEYSTTGVSADGRYLLATDLFRGVIVLHDATSGKDRIVADPARSGAGGGRMAGAVISPDGKEVAYGWSHQHDFELRIVKTDGSGARVLTRQAVTLSAWSPDGKDILAVQTLNPSGESRSFQIVAISAADGAFRILKQPGQAAVGSLAPSLDGKRLAYTLRLPEGYRSFLMTYEGLETPLRWGPSSFRVPVWAPDGSRLVFASDRSGIPGLWSERLANGQPAGEPEEIKGNFPNANVLGFARNGDLYYSVTKPTSDIYLANLDPPTGKLTSGPTRVNHRAVGNAWGRITWLPDGKSLCFWEQRNERVSVVVHTISTGDERDLWDHSPAPGAGPGYAGWFSDGRTLMSWEGKGLSRIAHRVDSRSMKILATWTMRENPRFSVLAAGFGLSPDLMTWFFACKDETVPCEQGACTYVLIARSLETGQDRELLRTNQYLPGSPLVSTDGQQIVLPASDNRTKEALLLVLKVGGGATREIYRGKDGPGDVLAWTADDQHILTSANVPGRGELRSFPANGGLPETSTFPMPILAGAVSPRGDQLAIGGSGRTKREIWVMTNVLSTGMPLSRPASPRP